MDDFTIIVIILISTIPFGIFLNFLNSISSKKNYILLEYIEFLEKKLCKKASDKELLKKIFILQRQNKYIIDTAKLQIRDYSKILKGE